MINRRNFVQGAALTAALSAASPAHARVRAAASLPWVLSDARDVASRVFAHSLERQGARVLLLPEGDMTAVWLKDIEPAWRRAPVPIAGLTRPAALFVLEQLAWSHGLRVVMHAEHLVAASTTRHQVLRCARADAAGSTRELELLGAAWPSAVADTIASWNAQLVAARVGPSCAGLAPVSPAGAQLLASWIIAPVRSSRS